ncbi:MAG: hypothetical protein ACR2L2_17570 [Acidobacteriota bacterium]
MPYHARLLAVAFGGLLTASPCTMAYGQDYDPQSNSYSYRGASVPRYFVVASFFDHLTHRYGTEPVGQAAFQEKLLTWGISSNLPAEEAVTKAMQRALLIAGRRLDLRPFLNDLSLFEKVQAEWFLKNVRDLRTVYRDFSEELQALGIDVGLIESYMDREIRPSITLSSLREPAIRTMMAAREFDSDPKSPTKPK